MIDKTGGPAFPTNAVLNEDGSIYQWPESGMTLRDWFAGQALMSMLSQPDKITDSTYAKAAELSYKFADAMIEEREKE
jgi:hypothetical protein